jgi:D-glycero-D-manno-heptose 1,7-bisphosphate phosphatase
MVAYLDRFVFFDRDGTLIEHEHHLSDHNRVVLKVDLAESLGRLARRGFRLGMITNQSVVARGLATVDEVHKIHLVIENHLNSNGIFFDLILFCPHQEEDNCECRKPKTGLIKEIENDVTVDFSKSFMVGDQSSDVQFGINLGMKTAQIIGMGKIDVRANFVGNSLGEIATWILEQR